MDEELYVVADVERGVVVAVFSNADSANAHADRLNEDKSWAAQVACVPFNPPPF